MVLQIFYTCNFKSIVAPPLIYDNCPEGQFELLIKAEEYICKTRRNLQKCIFCLDKFGNFPNDNCSDDNDDDDNYEDADDADDDDDDDDEDADDADDDDDIDDDDDDDSIPASPLLRAPPQESSSR